MPWCKHSGKQNFSNKDPALTGFFYACTFRNCYETLNDLASKPISKPWATASLRWCDGMAWLIQSRLDRSDGLLHHAGVVREPPQREGYIRAGHFRERYENLPDAVRWRWI